MKKPHIFYSDLYFMNFFFCPAFTDEEYSHAIKSTMDIDYDTKLKGSGRCTDVSMDNGLQGVFIWIRKPKDMDALVHECVHAAHAVMRSRGIKPDLDNDEPHAYLVGWIFNACRTFINE